MIGSSFHLWDQWKQVREALVRFSSSSPLSACLGLGQPHLKLYGKRGKNYIYTNVSDPRELGTVPKVVFSSATEFASLVILGTKWTGQAQGWCFSPRFPSHSSWAGPGQCLLSIISVWHCWFAAPESWAWLFQRLANWKELSVHTQRLFYNHHGVIVSVW